MREKYIVETLRRCRACGYSKFAVGGFPDLVHCTDCGTIYFVNLAEVVNPVAVVIGAQAKKNEPFRDVHKLA
jgi:uncharacterized Zn finger protein